MEEEDLDPVLNRMIAPGYAEEIGSSLEEAYRRLNVQHRFSSLGPDALETALGDAFGGVWFDDASGGLFVVGVVSENKVPSGPGVDRVRGILAAQRLTDDVAFVAVRWSQAELAEAKRLLRDDLRPLFTSGKVQTGLDIMHNAVRLSKASGLTHQESVTISRAVEACAVSVRVQQSAAASLFVRTC